MELKEISDAVDDLNPRIDRLRALYEQYFLGFEKCPPFVLRKEMDRAIYRLRRLRINNSRVRFRVMQAIQRYNTYCQRWGRILRQIEQGTYKRELKRAARRMGRREAAKRAPESQAPAERIHSESNAPDAGTAKHDGAIGLLDEMEAPRKVWDLSGLDDMDDLGAFYGMSETPPSQSLPPPPLAPPNSLGPPKKPRPLPPPQRSSPDSPKATSGGFFDQLPTRPDRSLPPPPPGPAMAAKSAPADADSQPDAPKAAPHRPGLKARPARTIPRQMPREPPPRRKAKSPPPTAEPTRKLYDDYVRAKRKSGEATTGVTLDKLTKSLERQRKQLQKKHGGSRSIDFEVVVRDGKTLIRAKVR